jgi:hypothetical protein
MVGDHAAASPQGECPSQPASGERCARTAHTRPLTGRFYKPTPQIAGSTTVPRHERVRARFSAGVSKIRWRGSDLVDSPLWSSATKQAASRRFRTGCVGRCVPEVEAVPGRTVLPVAADTDRVALDNGQLQWSANFMGSRCRRGSATALGRADRSRAAATPIGLPRSP